jgi:hypothetical protein
MRHSYNKFGKLKIELARERDPGRAVERAARGSAVPQTLVAPASTGVDHERPVHRARHCAIKDKHSTEKQITIGAYVGWFVSWRHGYIARPHLIAWKPYVAEVEYVAQADRRLDPGRGERAAVAVDGCCPCGE